MAQLAARRCTPMGSTGHRCAQHRRELQPAALTGACPDGSGAAGAEHLAVTEKALQC